MDPSPKEPAARSGMDQCCAWAQADGVPCPDLGLDCTECERGILSRAESSSVQSNDDTLKPAN